ncbi:MAG: hypothetical protein GX444_16475 [Myxococcales bacterium]|nr:hypothetical protein [Myxococcales bacterium]
MLGMASFALGGVVSGLLIAWSMDWRSPKELLQGALGGLAVGIGMSLLLPM